MGGWSVAGWIALGAYALLGMGGAGLWFFVELSERRCGRLFAAMGESMWFGSAGGPMLVAFAILVNLFDALGFSAGSRALSKLK